MGSVCFNASYGNQSVPGAVNSAPSPGSIDNDPAFQQLANAAWEAIQSFIKNPSDINTLLVMQDVKALNSYFILNGAPNPSDNPLAFAIYSEFSTPLFDGTTLLEACQMYGGSNSAIAVANLEALEKEGKNPFGSLANPYTGDPGVGLEAALNAIPSITKDRGPTYQPNDPLWSAFMKLQADLLAYQGTSKSLKAIAADILNLVNGLNKDHVTDGWLVNLLTLLNMPLHTSAGTLSLFQLASNYNSGNPTSVAQFEEGLGVLGEGKSPGGGDLYHLVWLSFFEEQYPLVPPS